MFIGLTGIKRHVGIQWHRDIFSAASVYDTAKFSQTGNTPVTRQAIEAIIKVPPEYLLLRRQDRRLEFHSALKACLNADDTVATASVEQLHAYRASAHQIQILADKPGVFHAAGVW